MSEIPETDELCANCARVDLFSLFTGPRYYPREGFSCNIFVPVGSLQQVHANRNCPLCRLIKHDVHEEGGIHSWNRIFNDFELSTVQCNLRPIRNDYYENSKYLNHKTQDMVATMVQIILSATPDSPEQVRLKISEYSRRHALLLLSPDSVDPSRPLLNGFRATTMEKSLALLADKISKCQAHHKDTCLLSNDAEAWRQAMNIQVINVKTRELITCDMTTTDYATLSYVWGQNTDKYTSSSARLRTEFSEGGQRQWYYLPKIVPKVIEDALFVCKAVSIPYLWVDLYCIHQHDAELKAAEIQAMASIYRCSNLTIVAGLPRSAHEDDEDQGFLPTSLKDDLGSIQKIETINNRQYICALQPIVKQIHASAWHERGWTFQEGHMARRIAFFGLHEISFMCGSGHWRESLHSGVYGHSSHIPELDLRSIGQYTLASSEWLRTSKWSFHDYRAIISDYSYRNLSFESDRLNAISGCFNMLGRKKGVKFIHGIPTSDFHYALLWEGEYDRPRTGFPSWSWAGWDASNHFHPISPRTAISGSLTQLASGEFGWNDEEATDLELQGHLITFGIESPHRSNLCSQRLASLSVSEAKGHLTIESEVVKLAVDIIADPGIVMARYETTMDTEGTFLPDFDTTVGQNDFDFDLEAEYNIPSGRVCFRDSSGNIMKRWEDWWKRWPTLRLNLPDPLRGVTLKWLLENGIELVRIMDIELIRGSETLRPFHHVLCLGLERRECAPGFARRMGSFCIPKEVWDAAAPSRAVVTLV